LEKKLAGKDNSNPGGISVDNALKLLGTTRDRLKTAERWGYIPRPKGQVYEIAPLVQGFCRFLSSGEVTIKDAAGLIGTSDEWVRRLISEGAIQRNERDNVTREQVVGGYIAWLKDEKRRSSQTATLTALQAARQREVELRTAIIDRRVVDLDEAKEALDQIVGTYRAELSGLASRVTKDIPLRRKIEAELDATLHRIAVLLDKTAGALEAGGQADEADPEDDA
jgi:hypothetical protein